MLVFLKLGGSLITEKPKPSTHRPQVLHRIAEEIVAALEEKPDLQLVLGHGSGSFGHMPAKKYNTRQGVSTPEEWLGFAEVWRQARTLHNIVLDALLKSGLALISFPVSASALTSDGFLTNWDIQPLKSAVDQKIIPLVYGDVVFDTQLGGTILSTEDIFAYLAQELHPERILLAGNEAGVWADYPECSHLVPVITPNNFEETAKTLMGSSATDVTGGMLTKVEGMLKLVAKSPPLEVKIFSGEKSGNIQSALLGKTLGTSIKVIEG